jgi:hypothetical protein
MARKSDRAGKVEIAVEEQLVPPVSMSFDDPEPPPQINGCNTVNGKPIPEEFATAIPYAMTDQGLWHKNHGKPKRMVEVGDGPWEKKLQQRRDMPWAGHDPFKEAVNEHREPGFSYRLLSTNVCDKRGKRGWEPVKDDKGNLVKVNSMFLGRMPVELAQERNEHYRRQGNEALIEAQERLVADQEKAIRDAGGQGAVSPLRRGDQLTDTREPERGAQIGFEQVRGRAA